LKVNTVYGFQELSRFKLQSPVECGSFPPFKGQGRTGSDASWRRSTICARSVHASSPYKL